MIKYHDINIKGHLENKEKNSIQYINEEIYHTQYDCSICIDNILLKNLHTTSCGHTFHKECIYKWIRKTNNCPNCRNFLQKHHNQKKDNHISYRSILIPNHNFPFLLRVIFEIYVFINRRIN